MNEPETRSGGVTQRGERGSVLILFAMLVFGVLGLAALTVDLGLARVTQESMQNAVDFAALEGLRGRDGDGVSAAVDRELARRQAARLGVLATFDEDLQDLEGLADGSVPNASLTLGIGPDVIETGTGVAGGQIILGASGGALVIVPDPQLNLDNFANGDFVAGQQLGFDPELCDVLLGLPPGVVEASDYTRCDFDASGAVGDASAAVSQDAFLARLRRTPDALGLDGVPGVSSNAPPLPYLFGRGSLLDPSPGSTLHDGLAVRATAVAGTRPVLAASLPAGGGPGLALMPVDTDADGFADLQGVPAFSVEAWSTCLADGALHPVVALDGGGLQLLDGCGLAEAGRMLTPGATAPGVMAVGEPAVDVGRPLLPVPLGTSWVALYADVDPGPATVERVVGFGAVRLSVSGTTNFAGPGIQGLGGPKPDGPGEGDFRVRRLDGEAGDGHVAPANATAVWIPDLMPTLTSVERTLVLTATANLPAPLLSPVLVH